MVEWKKGSQDLLDYSCLKAENIDLTEVNINVNGVQVLLCDR